MKLRKITTMFTALAMFIALNVTSVYAEATEDVIEHEHGTASSATVSEDTDKANNSDTKMETSFYMYCPPDPTYEDIPQMGDNGLNTTSLLISTLATGIAFVCIASRDYEHKKECDMNEIEA